MPHYFFHLLSPDHAPVRDEEGLAFEDDDAAMREGVRSLGDLLMEAGLSRSLPFTISVQVERTGTGIVDVLTGQLSRRSGP